MPSAVTGSSDCWPNALWPACTLSRLPRRPSSASKPDLDDWEMPSTPTMAAMPMLMPSADKDDRTRRLRRPRLPTRTRSRRDSRDAPAVASRRRIAPDLPVADLEPAIHRRGHLVVVGDHHDGGPFVVQLAEQLEDGR